ncbi:MAG: class F sortase [Catenulispora sp.]|nr:class F sortase [Catenulispora sp.]
MSAEPPAAVAIPVAAPTTGPPAARQDLHQRGSAHQDAGIAARKIAPLLPGRFPVRPGKRRLRSGLAPAVASVAAAVVGSAVLLRSLASSGTAPPPQPPPWAARALPTPVHHAAALGFARPVRVTVARVGIHADVLALGLGRGGGVGVPGPDEALKAAWYDRGPAPGQAGPAVITGHVDSRAVPDNRAAFYELGAVRPGDVVEVARADRRTAVFAVDTVALVPKSRFPTRAVYGPTGYPALRLITCGGRYDPGTGYAANIIVYAHLVGAR